MNRSTTSDDQKLSNEDIIQVSVVVFQIFLSVTGNGVVFYVIYSNLNLRTLRNIFTASLAASDFLLACTDMVSVVVAKLSTDYQPSSSICYLVLLSGVLFSSGSVFSLTAMSVNRYVAIRFPLRYRHIITPKRSTLILFLIWIAAMALATPPLLWRPADVVCNSAATPSSAHFIPELLYMICEWFFWFILPAVTISFCNFRILGIARRQARLIAAAEVPCVCNFVTSSKVRAMSINDRKASRMVTLLMAFWLVCWLPFFTVLTIHKFVPNFVPPSLMTIFLCLMFCNSAGNPFLLTLFNKEMKTGIKRLLCKPRIWPERSERQSTTFSRRNTHRIQSETAS